jgi:hypothetical protein
MLEVFLFLVVIVVLVSCIIIYRHRWMQRHETERLTRVEQQIEEERNKQKLLQNNDDLILESRKRTTKKIVQIRVDLLTIETDYKAVVSHLIN